MRQPVLRITLRVESGRLLLDLRGVPADLDLAARVRDALAEA